MSEDRSKEVIETVADGLRLQVGDLAGDYVPTLLKARPAAYVVGFVAGVSRALGEPVGNHTIRSIERGCRQGLPQQPGDAELDDLRAKGEEEGRAFVEDREPPSLLSDIVYE